MYIIAEHSTPKVVLMDTLDGTNWDVVIYGTGLSQSLLALALSRSDKKTLHLDRNDYYGENEAAFSLEEAEVWAERVSRQSASLFKNVLRKGESQGDSEKHKLSYSRAYSLTLSPQLIYTRSNLLPALVTSKVHQQLEFLAVGSWWIYEAAPVPADKAASSSQGSHEGSGSLRKIPSSREDVVNDQGIDLRSKRSVMRFLQLAASEEAHLAAVEESGSMLFQDFLSSRFKIPEHLQAPIHALPLAPEPPSKVSTAFALPRIHRHLTSVGLFGAGFGAVVPKWGGLAEVAQVGCRAGAVGGGVYVLDKGIESVLQEETDNGAQLLLKLSGDEIVKAKKVIGWDNKSSDNQNGGAADETSLVRTINIISSPLQELFPPPQEGAHPAAAAVVVFPSGSIGLENSGPADLPPVYLMVHSSDTGECPAGQSVVYGQVLASSNSSQLLESAIARLLQSVKETSTPESLWRMQYTHTIAPPAPDSSQLPVGVLHLQPTPPGLVLENDVLHNVRTTWEKIVGEEQAASFMTFQERETLGQEDEDAFG